MSTYQEDLQTAIQLMSKYGPGSGAVFSLSAWNEMQSLIVSMCATIPLPEYVLQQYTADIERYMTVQIETCRVLFYRGYLAGLEEAKSKTGTITFVVGEEDRGNGAA